MDAYYIAGRVWYLTLNIRYLIVTHMLLVTAGLNNGLKKMSENFSTGSFKPPKDVAFNTENILLFEVKYAAVIAQVTVSGGVSRWSKLNVQEEIKTDVTIFLPSKFGEFVSPYLLIAGQWVLLGIDTYH